MQEEKKTHGVYTYIHFHHELVTNMCNVAATAAKVDVLFSIFALWDFN